MPRHPEQESPPALTLERVAAIARKETLEKGGHTPTVIVVTDKGVVTMPVIDLPATPASRLEWMFAAGHALAQDGSFASIRRVFFVSEAWMSIARDGKRPPIQPSKDPERIEVLTIAQLDVVSQTSELLIYEMVRNFQGQVSRLVERGNSRAEQHEVGNPLLSSFLAGFVAGNRARLN